MRLSQGCTPWKAARHKTTMTLHRSAAALCQVVPTQGITGTIKRQRSRFPSLTRSTTRPSIASRCRRTVMPSSPLQTPRLPTCASHGPLTTTLSSRIGMISGPMLIPAARVTPAGHAASSRQSPALRQTGSSTSNGAQCILRPHQLKPTTN